MALAAQQLLLDTLMGKGRNKTQGENTQIIRFDNPEVCKFMLVDFCPHDLFINTRKDLGLCDKIHNVNFQKEYQASSRYGKLGYEEEYERFLNSLIADVERRIQRAKERLRVTQGDPDSENDPQRLRNALLNKIKDLDDKINSHILKSEQLGNACQVDEAQRVVNECEEMRAEKNKLQLQLTDLNANSDKVMEVCNVCGSLLVVGDIPSRVDEHLFGKQHAGYAKVRASLEALTQRKIEMLEKERAQNSRKRVRSESKDEKPKRRRSPSPPHHHRRDRQKSDPRHHRHHPRYKQRPSKDHRRR